MPATSTSTKRKAPSKSDKPSTKKTSKKDKKPSGNAFKKTPRVEDDVDMEDAMENDDPLVSDDDVPNDDMDIDLDDKDMPEGTQPPSKRPKSDSATTSKEAHAKQRQVKADRKAAKPHAEDIIVLKKLWEKLRSPKTPKEDKAKIVDEMLALLKGKMHDVIFKHDASRMIQWCLKEGTSTQRAQVALELKSHAPKLAQSTYSKFLVMRMLEYCPQHRTDIIKSFYGHVRKFVKHKEASTIVEEIYGQYASSVQKAALLEEFYGPEFAIFKKTDEKRTLADILASDPTKRPSIMKHLLEAIRGVLDKGTSTHSIVHRAMLDFISITKDDKEMWELSELVKDYAAEIVHTKEGSRVVMEIVLRASAKDRKSLLKGLKEWVHKMAVEEYGHLVLLRIFDCVDDTVLVSKTVLSELSKHVHELVHDKYGRRVLLYVLVGRAKKYFFKETLARLEEGDAVRAQTSKKDPMARHNELLVAMSPSLIEYATEHTVEMLLNGQSSQVYVEIVLHATGDKEALLVALEEAVKEPLGDESHLLVHSNASRMIKAILQHEQDDKVTTMVAKAIEGRAVDLVEHGGGFVVLAIIEKNIDSSLKKEVSAKKAKERIEQAVSGGNKGAQVLLSKL